MCTLLKGRAQSSQKLGEVSPGEELAKCFICCHCSWDGWKLNLYTRSELDTSGELAARSNQLRHPAALLSSVQSLKPSSDPTEYMFTPQGYLPPATFYFPVLEPEVREVISREESGSARLSQSPGGELWTFPLLRPLVCQRSSWVSESKSCDWKQENPRTKVSTFLPWNLAFNSKSRKKKKHVVLKQIHTNILNMSPSVCLSSSFYLYLAIYIFVLFI